MIADGGLLAAVLVRNAVIKQASFCFFFKLGRMHVEDNMKFSSVKLANQVKEEL